MPSNLYSFSFAPNPNWTETFSGQPEIERYLQDTARRYGVLDRIAFDAALEAARWDADRSVWDLDTVRGSLTADVLISGGGGLSEPSIPDLHRRRVTFAGTSFHSAQWNHDHDLTGRRVAIIGTGASTIQFLPQVQRAGRARHPLPAHAAVGLPPPQPAHPRRRAHGLPAAALDAADVPGPQLLDGRADAGHHAHPQQPDAAAPGGAGPAVTWPARCAIPNCGPS